MRRSAKTTWSFRAPSRSVEDIAPAKGHNGFWARLGIRQGKRVYAICFDLDQDQLQANYHGANPTNAYGDIRRILERHGFVNQQGSVYFGNEEIDPVRCVLAVQEVTNTYAWFRVVVRDIRMLRIEENNDLMPAVEPQGSLLGGGAPAAAE